MVKLFCINNIVKEVLMITKEITKTKVCTKKVIDKI